ncbi:carboxylating nicotinate-nucleotide diphosphorylase [Nordella sp. HKS 07]|uniref:carboxylating nicotinate-nucleotide diphosphorylase n=1 Tax=Nordella sp. HKS 07 TaxID=2712222 RepID=UPI0013E16CAA|nr:carboxylating nicotinate-nucleotide diphosphorylase [Nordella sp. HKS 07]QIG49089.1 carboxylating nicotinate-nucleotide diphosphorylase [Nordella sp. HKS 07]
MTIPLLFDDLIRATLREDLGLAGDITTDAIVPETLAASAALVARRPGVVAGLDVAVQTFRLLDPNMSVKIGHRDGAKVATGETIATFTGNARALLTAERTALNFLCHLSGIATATAHLCTAIEGHKARIVCTRKTTPGLRALEKHAVRLGGGGNHRFGLDDAVLIKDNHIAIAGGIRPAVDRARRHAGHLTKIEVEVDTLAQLEEVLALEVDAVLLDNMTPATLSEAVRMIDGRCLAEASGNVTRETVAAIAASGVDLISVGWLTHSAPALDIGLDFLSD